MAEKKRPMSKEQMKEYAKYSPAQLKKHMQQEKNLLKQKQAQKKKKK